ncbi:MAG: hypothetical protein ACLP4W_22470 [Mycobacterium sp.]|uniref:hypothetical protein n=1 Tax=Mycobacterium sp. TaxID=1785 RepID=UPI003F9A6610
MTTRKPTWVLDLTEHPDLRDELAVHGPDAFFVVSPYASPSGEALDEYYRSRGFTVYQDHEDGGLMTTPEMRYLMAGLIGTHNIGSTSGGVVVPIRDGIDLPMPSGEYRVRVTNEYGDDLFTVSRIHIVDGQERVEGSVETDFVDVGELVHRAGCYVNWDEQQWTDIAGRP